MASDTNITRQSGNGDAITTMSMGVAASANGLALAQTPAAAGNLILNGGLIAGGVYKGTSYQAGEQTFFAARRMVVASDSAGDNTQTVTFTGTDRYNNVITEAVLLTGAATITTTQDFATVTQIAISAAAVGNITAGTSAKASGAWIIIDRIATSPINIALLATLVSGAANFTVEETFDDPNGNQAGTLFPQETINGLQTGTNFPPVAQADGTIVTKAATTQGTITVPFWAYRLTINSGTGAVQLQGLSAVKPWH